MIFTDGGGNLARARGVVYNIVNNFMILFEREILGRNYREIFRPRFAE